MSKKKYIVIILTVVLLLTSIYTFIHCYFNFDSKECFRENIKNGDYVFVGSEIVHPFLFGSTEVGINIFDHVNNMDISFKTKIKNWGKELTEDNYKIEYHQDYLKVSFFDYKGEISTVHRFYFEDFEELTIHDWNP